MIIIVITITIIMQTWEMMRVVSVQQVQYIPLRVLLHIALTIHIQYNVMWFVDDEIFTTTTTTTTVVQPYHGVGTIAIAVIVNGIEQW